MDPRAIAHARVEAQRLLKRTKGPSFELPQTLGAAQNLIASLKGFPHWHALIASSRPEEQEALCTPKSEPQNLPRPASTLSITLDVDQRMLPDPGEPVRSTWLYGKPGSCKSFTLALNVLDHCLSRLNALPRVAMVDIGQSSKGMVETLQAHLLPSQRERLVRYVPITPRTHINPFDTPLGLRAPIGQDRHAKINWLQSVLSSDPRRPLPYVIAADLLDRVYHVYQEPLQALRHRIGAEPKIDALLHAEDPMVLQISDLTWWTVVDACMDLGRFDLARLAQRHAMPTLLNIVWQLSNQQDVLGSAIPRDHRAAIEQSLDPVRSLWFGGLTTEDWDDARVVVIDLDKVYHLGGAMAQRLSALSYLSAQVALGNQPGTLERVDDLQNFVKTMERHGVRQATIDRYQSWHADMLKHTPTSSVVYDEIHRCSHNAGVMDHAMRDLSAPSRSMLIASQSLDMLAHRQPDGRRSLDLFHHGVTLDRLNDVQRPLFYATLGWDDSSNALLNDVGLITKTASINMLKLTRVGALWTGRIHNYRFPLGPLMWSLTTSKVDLELKSALILLWGRDLTLQRLAQRFPLATCREELAATGLSVQGLVDQLWAQHENANVEA